MGQGLLIIEASQPHQYDFWASDQPNTETSTW